MINPDFKDLRQTEAIRAALKVENIRVVHKDTKALEEETMEYDCIWSLSVVEHISGKYDDRDAVKIMYRCLARGGRLVLTVPVDRKFWTEFRSRAYYGMSTERKAGSHFFQRFYDKAAIRNRLIQSVGKEPSVVRWFGETSPGRFQNYIQQWIKMGVKCTARDPKEIVDHYREFSEWEEMPGAGVCGLMIEKE